MIKYYFAAIMILSCSNTLCYGQESISPQKKLMLLLKEVDAIKNAPLIFDGLYTNSSKCEDVPPLDTSKLKVHQSSTNNLISFEGNSYCRVKVLHVYKGDISIGDTIELFINYNSKIFFMNRSGSLEEEEFAATDSKTHYDAEPGDLMLPKIFYCKSVNNKKIISTKSRIILKCFEETPSYRSITGQFRHAHLHFFTHGSIYNACFGRSFQMQRMINANPSLTLPEEFSHLQKM